jgi:4'-phosphopantetheinyl transferase
MLAQSWAAEVWLADIDELGPLLDDAEQGLSLLPDADHARLAAMSDQSEKQRWRRCRIATRLVLAAQLGIERARLPFLRSELGRPMLADAGSLDFSISHSGPVALIGLTTMGSIGVDVETRSAAITDERRQAAIETAAAALAPEHPLPEANPRRLLQAWTRLEAVAKATGMGVGGVLTRLGIHGPATDMPGAASLCESAARLLALGAAPLRVDDLHLGASGVAAVAVPRRTSLTQRQLATLVVSPSRAGLPTTPQG